MRGTLAVVVSVVVMLATAGVGWAESNTVLLEKGIYTEQTLGDLDEAIKIYEQIVADASAQRNTVARAQYRLGMCYLKKGRNQQALVALEKVVAQFPDQTELVAQARPVIDGLVYPDPASLMPADTLAYVEMGSPGVQIEKTLNLLKGTRWENPLAAVAGAATQPAAAQGGKSPGDIAAALLNPAMMNEFKKIRGMAIGLVGFNPGGSQPAVGVFYPGESDALRGLIMAGLLMVGRPGQPVEGMQTVLIEDQAACAYDERVMIVASPPERLSWSVRQYKGLSDDPTLASADTSLARLTSRDARRENALTVWADVTRLLSYIKQSGFAERDLLIVEKLLDVENIDGVAARLVIDERDIFVEAMALAKDDHACLAYDLIRTPNLTRGGFEAVPADAFAVVSFALGEASGASQAAERAVKRVTGLDIGRELFANIEQVTLFALSPSNTDELGVLWRDTSPLFPHLGLAITSGNPQQTRLLLDRLLGVADVLNSPERARTKDELPGRYCLFRTGGQDVYCHVGQAGKSTVVAVDQAVVDAALSAAKDGQSALTAGPLHEALSALEPDVSKLVLVNAGGAIKTLDTHIRVRRQAATTQPDAQAKSEPSPLAGLAAACAATNVQLQTREEPNRLSVKVAVLNLPPLGKVVELVQQLQQSTGMDFGLRTRTKRREVVVVLPKPLKVSKLPISARRVDGVRIDGTLDEWADVNAQVTDVEERVRANSQVWDGPEDCSFTTRIAYDDKNLYLAIDVTDEKIVMDMPQIWQRDSIEVFLDPRAASERSDRFAGSCRQVLIAVPSEGEPPQVEVLPEDQVLASALRVGFQRREKGYVYELAVPWAAIGGKPEPSLGNVLHLTVYANDKDAPSQREQTSCMVLSGDDDANKVTTRYAVVTLE